MPQSLKLPPASCQENIPPSLQVPISEPSPVVYPSTVLPAQSLTPAPLEGKGAIVFGTRLEHSACTPSPLAGEGRDGGKLTIAAALPAFTPTLTLPRRGGGDPVEPYAQNLRRTVLGGDGDGAWRLKPRFTRRRGWPDGAQGLVRLVAALRG
jgi:hypothetical protein